jgi:kumamolisin
MQMTPLPGSERAILPGARAIGSSNPDERFETTLILRRRAADAFARVVEAAAKGDVASRIAHADFVDQFGASNDDIAAVRAFAARNGLVVVHEAPERRTVILSGTVAQFSAAFGVTLERYEHANGTYRGRVGAVMIPDDLHGVVTAVLGLDDRPQAQPHFRMQRPNRNIVYHATPAASYLPTQIAELYGFPASTGAGQCIALIELGGGYRPADLQTYFAQAGIATPPTVTAVSVDHATNAPTGSADGPDGEVMLDIEVAGAIAPGAHIVVYFAPNTDAGFLDAVTTAIHDTTNKPTVISISWGGPESTWTSQATTSFDEAFQSATALGITVCVAAGDNGSTDGVTDGANHVDFPASSTYALACGGTSIRTAGNAITAETVWNDGANGGMTGGGVSTIFPLPAWQAQRNVTTGTTATALTMRGVLDVAGNADPESGYRVLVDGTSTVIGGTSAVAPLWAALVARCNAIAGTNAGFVQPRLYADEPAFNDIVQGNNGAYSASPNWDACTGLGSPRGAAIVTALQSPQAPA